jgi:hypothetical protein
VANQLPLDFPDLISYIEREIETEKWITVYSQGGFYSILAPNTVVPKLVQDCSWDTHMDSGYPNVEDWRAGNQEYARHGGSLGLEPLVVFWEYHGIKESFFELAEEFRIFYNLWFDHRTNQYLAILADGTEHVVARITKTACSVRGDCLREFLAAKRFTLVIYFDEVRRSTEKLESLGLSKRNDVFSDSKWHYCLDIGSDERSSKYNSIGRLCGKRFISASRDYRSSFDKDLWGDYLEFIIGTDANGQPIVCSCDPDKLQNLFGANPNAHHYLTPVFFERGVLGKYLDDTEKYTVTDGDIACGSLWSLRIDNNHPDFIVVYLGDLGKYLPSSERHYWRSFNVAHEGTVSPVTFKRSILAQFTDPQIPDLALKQKLTIFTERWTAKFGWPLFKPLNDEDSHNIDSLTIPLHDNHKSFDEQVLSLSKCLIESLNVVELRKLIKVESSSASISIFEQFLNANSVKNTSDLISFLRNLQDLRDGASHRKGNKYLRGAAYFSIDDRGFTKAFEYILEQAIHLIDTLSSHFLNRR